MTFGICGRLDCGGLATQTVAAIKHLNPDKILIADLQGSRGPIIYNYWPDKTTFAPSLFTREVIEEFLDGLSTVLCFEATYGGELCGVAANRGVRVFIQANPELRVPSEWHGATVFAPTDWEHDRNPSERIIPVPIDREALPFRQRTQCTTFYHVSAPAMLDRNGTDIVLAAAKYVTHPCRLIVRGATGDSRFTQQIGPVQVVYLRFEPRPYSELWPDEADVLLLPRRYGGLCLPMQEAASLGMPALMLDIPPVNAYPHTFNAKDCGYQLVPMKGGPDFKVYVAEPRELARRMDELIVSPGLVTGLSNAADKWAEALSWDEWLPIYEELLGLEPRERIEG